MYRKYNSSHLIFSLSREKFATLTFRFILLVHSRGVYWVTLRESHVECKMLCSDCGKRQVRPISCTEWSPLTISLPSVLEGMLYRRLWPPVGRRCCHLDEPAKRWDFLKYRHEWRRRRDEVMAYLSAMALRNLPWTNLSWREEDSKEEKTQGRSFVHDGGRDSL